MQQLNAIDWFSDQPWGIMWDERAARSHDPAIRNYSWAQDFNFRVGPVHSAPSAEVIQV